MILFILSWLAVSQDCLGRPEAIQPLYEVWTYRAEISGYQMGLDGQPWPVYSRTENRQVTSGISVPLAEPGMGGMVAYRVEAVDLAGNRSDGPCN